ncbi:MAG: cysteine--tRNA ligase [Patescibacteria group bacterium]
MLKIYNSLSRTVEEFHPITPDKVGIYTCGPTVYDFAHIGNFRSYSTADLLVRILKYNGFALKFVMNITDVGHMTLDQAGGGDGGEDKMEKSAKKEGKSVWELAQFYTDIFLKDYTALNYTEPTKICKATDHILEQIELIKQIEANGYTYITSDGVYFDTSLLKDYGKLSSLDKTDEGKARVEANDEKKNPRDFALWKFSYPGGRSFESAQDDKLSKRQMEWKSPWGKGFPGWHIECSAMSMKYLGETFDIHTGGIDHKEIHHPNEIAQAEAATNKPLANYWVHTAFMLVAGQKMSKSLKNIYTLYDLEKEGYEPLALRYLYLQTHYRQEMNFTFPALDAASNALKNLRREIASLPEPDGFCDEYDERFLAAINDDLNIPQALGVAWEMLKSDNPTGAKAGSLYKMDEILGLNLQESVQNIQKEEGIVPEEIKELLHEREELRKMKKFNAADQIRSKLSKMGYDIEDGKKGTRVWKK